MFKRVLVLCSAVVGMALSAPGADFSGMWTGQTTDRNGDVQDLSFRLSQKGDALTGKMYGDNESTPIADARIHENEITFSVTSELNGAITKFVYTGTMNGDEIVLTRERGGPKNNNAGGNAAAGNPANRKQIFKLKRLA